MLESEQRRHVRDHSTNFPTMICRDKHVLQQGWVKRKRLSKVGGLVSCSNYSLRGPSIEGGRMRLKPTECCQAKLQAGLEGNRLLTQSINRTGQSQSPRTAPGNTPGGCCSNKTSRQPSWTGQLDSRPGTSTDQQASTHLAQLHSDTKCLCRAVASLQLNVCYANPSCYHKRRQPACHALQNAGQAMR